jgi:hypothetical protein
MHQSQRPYADQMASRLCEKQKNRRVVLRATHAVLGLNAVRVRSRSAAPRGQINFRDGLSPDFPALQSEQLAHAHASHEVCNGDAMHGGLQCPAAGRSELPCRYCLWSTPLRWPKIITPNPCIQAIQSVSKRALQLRKLL